MGSQSAYSRYSYSIQTWTGPQGSRGLGLPEFIDNWHMKVVTLSALRTRRHQVSFLLEGDTTLRKKKKKFPITPSEFEPPTFHLVAQCLDQPRHRVPLLLSELLLVLTCVFLKDLYVSKTAVLISTASLPISNVPSPICKSCRAGISKIYVYLKQLHVSLKRVSKTSDPILGKCKSLHVVALMFSSRKEFFLSSAS